MILRRLRSFATVAEEGGISRAAVRLLIAQPALSRQISDLERTVGISLFDRDNRGVRLTSAGSRLREDIQRVFARLDDVICRAILAHEGKVGTLRLGLSRGALVSRRIGQVIRVFREEYPNVELLLREIEVTSQARALKANEVDGAIGLGDESDSALIATALFEEHVDSAAFVASHRLAVPGPIDPSELMDEQLRLDAVTLPRLRGLREGLARLGFTWTEVEGLNTVAGYVAAGNGWTTALSSIQADPPAGFVVRPIRGLHVPLPMVLRWKKHDDLPILRNLAAVAARVCDAPMEYEPAIRDDAPSSSAATTTPPLDPAQHVEVRQLVALVTSLNEGSLSGAATRLGLTQSAISRQINALERAVGVALIARAGHRLLATAAGAVLREEAPPILEQIDRALERARRTVRGIVGHCAIGTMARELTNGVLVDVLKEVTERYPDVTITVVEGRLGAPLREGNIDLAVVANYPGASEDPSISSLLLQEDPLICALMAESHPLAAKSTLAPNDLIGEPFLFVAREFAPAAYDLIVQELHKFGLGPDTGTAYDGARPIWNAVASGAGWTIGPRSLHNTPPAGIVARPIEGVHIPWGIGLQWRSDEADPIVSRVADIFRAKAHTSLQIG